MQFLLSTKIYSRRRHNIKSIFKNEASFCTKRELLWDRFSSQVVLESRANKKYVIGRETKPIFTVLTLISRNSVPPSLAMPVLSFDF